ncbi:hypothetical protein OIU77_029244 [Salix suchowensis]|uniref:Oligopeptidase A N-terminal domain-containing protein n=1 Tax=Salix suchowensis TaxID=1278906 RepID=A0ABQ9BNH3_9ROSI|nr:hypothetical protein OIU78_008901 [Salix suchowensis]KAJ6386233.1 hypothetical protein OIU77_029244 [Salix suchowensis]
MQESNLVELETRVEPTWPRLGEPLEKIKDRLSVVWGIALNADMDSPELCSAIEEVQFFFFFLKNQETNPHDSNKTGQRNQAFLLLKEEPILV